MADPALDKLREAFVQAPAGSVTLNDAFWTGAGLTPPPDFTASIKAAYRLPAESEGLDIEYARDKVGEINDGKFEIPGVSLKFLTAPEADTTAQIQCRADAPETPILGIDVVPGGWQLKDLFPAMTGWPFNILNFDQQRFYYSSVKQEESWSGIPLRLAAGQNLYGKLTVPKPIQVLIDLIDNLPDPPDVVMYGPVVLDKADNKKILLPDMEMRAPIPGGQDLKLFFIDVVEPHIGFVINTIEETSKTDAGEEETRYLQTPYYFLGTDVALTGTDGETLPMALRALVSQSLADYRFSVSAVDASTPITPASVIALMAGQSYFTSVPPALQEYLASVQMKGFNLSGPLKPTPQIGTISAMLGSVQDRPISFFADPTTGEVFEIDEFMFSWTMISPLEPKARQTLASFVAKFKLFPEIFRTNDGDPGGIFEISINQALDFSGQFDGKASFSDVLSGITAGAIQLPEGVEVEFSDIFVTVQPSAKAYALGFTVDANLDVPFISGPNGQPLIQVNGMDFRLGASTPNLNDEQPGKTVYTGSMDGQVVVGPAVATVRIDYDGGAEPPLWQLDAGLAQPLEVSELIKQFFGNYEFPPFLPSDLTIEEFGVKAKIPTVPSKTTTAADRLLITRPARHVGSSHHPHGWRSPVRPVNQVILPRELSLAEPPAKPPKPSYNVAGKLSWSFRLTDTIQIDTLADIGVSYDGNRKPGQEFAGSVIGTITIDAIGATVEIGYRFGPASADAISIRMPMTEDMRAALAEGKDSVVLWMAWNGFRAEYSFETETVTFSMNGWTVGSLITALVEMIGDPYFTLPAPWDLLNQISLNGLSISFDLRKGVKNRVTAGYSLPSPLNLGFMTINGLSFKQVDGKATLAIDGKVQIPGMQDTPLFKPNGEGQDVKNMPPVPGRGNSYFKLNLLALGQHVSIDGTGTFKSTQEVIKAMSDVPATDGPGLPFDPTQRKKGQPYYNSAAGWLAALHFGVLKVPGTETYSVDMMIAFADPDLAGLRLALNGEKMKVLAGLAIDILYQRVTDDIGVYKIEFTLPSVLRNLDFGAVSITLPVIGIQIYTNGDFLIDFGFPRNMDFSRSFTVQAIIYGVPVLGSGGFYFGKLSNATAPGLPPTTLGTFHPVIVFGLGLQLGIGRQIDKGIFKAGFSITVFGIIEGTLAAWHPYEEQEGRNSPAVQGDYYFKVTGTIGIIGQLYGSIDFVLIKADVKLRVVVYVQATYESFRKIPLVLSASVQVSASVKIDLGFFSISISFSFSASITEKLTVGSDSQAPWDAKPPMLEEVAILIFGPDKALVEARRPPLPRTLFEHGIVGRAFRIDFERPFAALAEIRQATGATAKTPIEITAITQFTVLAPKDAGYAGQEGGFVLLFTMDAPVASSDPIQDPGGDTSFGKLCEKFLPWIIASVEPEVELPLPDLADGDISRPVLEGILQTLSDPKQAPFTADQIIRFLQENFELTVSAADETLGKARKTALSTGSTIFPAVNFLSMAVPDPNADSGDVTVNYNAYVTATEAYQAEIRRIFNEIAAQVAVETGNSPQSDLANANASSSLAATVFTDYFVLLARQLVQASIDSFDDYPYPLTPTTSLQDILDWADETMKGQLSPSALAAANMTYPMTGGNTLDFADLDYMVQQDDTLNSIAAHYASPSVSNSTTPADLITTNRAQNNLINPDVVVEITVDDELRKYTTSIGDDFNAIAAGLNVFIDTLAADAGLYDLEGLLAAAVVTRIPNVKTKTTDGDTIAAILERLHVPTKNFLTKANLDLEGLFRVDDAIRFAVPELIVLKQDALWPAILTTGTLGQTAGQAARYMLHGMRLPVAPGLEIPSQGFLYGPPHWSKIQDAYGLYQLTGQQFPLATREGSYPITLTRPEGVQYDWFKLGNGASLSFDIEQQAKILTQIVTTAKTNGYKPKVERLAPTPETNLSARSFGATNYVPWLTSDITSLTAVTAAPSSVTDTSASAPQAKPILFDVSAALQTNIETTQAALATRIPTVAEMRPYLPALSPSVGTSDPATSQTTYTDIDDYCFATRIDFRIKHLAQDADLSPQTPSANDVTPPDSGNSGSLARPLAPFAYEIIGPNPGQSVLLERLLTAMASEGEDLISGLYLLYADINNGASGLTSRASSEFLSFIVQSNLSTETNPPPMAPALATASVAEPPSGIANTPAEFIKLLWELSTVNTGGSYLFYQLLDEGTGLPPGLFDESGVAVITLVATVRRAASPEKGERMFNAINALLTTAPIDPKSSVVKLTGVSRPATSLALPASETPEAIAASYGINIGGLVAANTDVLLNGGKEIPISGLFRQLTPDDVAPGEDPLAMLSAYYSVGALDPVTAEQIRAFNPGIAVEKLAVFRIPPFVYAVGNSGPGNSFAKMATYYRTEVSAIGYAARDVADLFAAQTLTIDPVSMDATTNLGLGNAALELDRERGRAPEPLPPTPTKAELEAYTRDTLLQLYQLLSARIVGTPFFKASPDSATFGPKDPDNTQTANTPEPRFRKRLLSTISVDQPYLYDQAVGYGKSSLVNAAPTPAKPGLPPADLNPYRGIGVPLQIAVDWQDLFGNRIPNPFGDPEAGDPPPFGSVPMSLLYPDRLMPLDSWPSTTRSYGYSGTAGAPVLDLYLKFDTSPYEPEKTKSGQNLMATRLGDELPIWQRNAHADLEKMQQVYFQLNQNYSDLHIPGLNGPAVSMSLVNSLLATPEQPMPDFARKAILDYVNAAVEYLASRATGNTPEAPTDVTVAIPVPLSSISTDKDIIELTIEMRFTRAAELVTPPLRALDDGLAAVSTVPVDGSLKAPNTADAGDTAEFPVALTEFALKFEEYFVENENWHMRVGTSAPDPSTPNDTRAPTVWAVRFADKTGPAQKGIGYDIGGTPSYFAPLPIASNLQTLTVPAINRYTTGAPYPDSDPLLETTFTNVDPNVWLSECLIAVDNILTASYSTPLFQLDRLLGLTETQPGEEQTNENTFSQEKAAAETGYLTRLLEHKKTLASAIASTATSVLQTPTQGLTPAATEKLEQDLLRQLSNANTLTCVAVFPVSDAHYGPSVPTGITAPRLFGQPHEPINLNSPDAAEDSRIGTNDNFALSTAKIPLQDTADVDTSTLAFIVSSRSAETEAFVELDLNYALSHIEHDIHGVPGIQNYQQSRWITFLTGPFERRIVPADGGKFAIPVALRALPTPATVVAQAGKSSYQDPSSVRPAELKDWKYEFSYLLQQAAQDSVIADVIFNLDAADTAKLFKATKKEKDLYEALAQFVAIYPAVERDLETYLRPINGTTKADNPDVKNAEYAIDALNQVVDGVAKAYKKWAEPDGADLESAVEPPKIEYTFEILLVPEGDDPQIAQIDVLPMSFQRNSIDAANFLPLAKILIDPDNYEPVLIDSNPTTGAATWRYKLREDAGQIDLPEWLPYETARLNSARAVIFDGLDLFTLQNGWASVQVTRNRHLSPHLSVKTTSAFEFTTAAARFADPLVPLIDIGLYPLDPDATEPKPVSEWLNAFFSDFLAPGPGADGEDVLLKMETLYRYNLVADQGSTVIPQTVQPVSLLTPTSTDGATNPPFVAKVGEVAQNWFDAQNPLIDNSAGFDFGLTVFSGTGENNLPLMKIEALTLAASKVKKI